MLDYCGISLRLRDKLKGAHDLAETRASVLSITTILMSVYLIVLAIQKGPKRPGQKCPTQFE